MIADDLGFDGALGTICEVEDGKYTGRAIRAAARGEQGALHPGARLRPRREHRVLRQPHRSPVPRGGRASGRGQPRPQAAAHRRRSAAGRCSSSDAVQRDEGLSRLEALGFDAGDAATLWEHFDDAEQRGKLGHGYSRIPWLEQLEGYDPQAEPALVVGRGRLPALERQRRDRLPRARARRSTRRSRDPPEHARLVVCERTFPTGMLGHYVRRLAERRARRASLTATSPARLGPPGGPKVAGTNPLAIGIPSPTAAGRRRRLDGRGHVGRRDRRPRERGAARAVRRRAVAQGVRARGRAAALRRRARRREPGHGAVLLVARPEADPVPALRATGIRLPGG